MLKRAMQIHLILSVLSIVNFVLAQNAELEKNKLVLKAEESSEFCQANIKFDKKTRYCGLYAGFNSPFFDRGAIYQTIVEIHSTDMKELQRNIDMTFKVGYENNNELVQTDGITVYPYLVNITDPSVKAKVTPELPYPYPNLAMRNYYQAEKCNSQTPCGAYTEATFKSVPINTYVEGKYNRRKKKYPTEQSFTAQFVLLISDARMGYYSSFMGQASPLLLQVELSNNKDNEKLGTFSTKINIQKAWNAVPIFKIGTKIKDFDGFEFLNTLAAVGNAGVFFAFIGGFGFFFFRRLKNMMKSKTKFSELIKKFDEGNEHLELNAQKDIFDEENEDRRLLLESEEADSALNDSRVSVNASEVSHYEEDENGKVRRIMIKKSEKQKLRNMIHEKFEFKQEDIRKSSNLKDASVNKSKTFKNGVQGHMNDTIENQLEMLSEGTIDNPKYPTKINRTYSQIEGQLCEEPPQFVDSENQDYDDLIGKSIDPNNEKQLSQRNLGESKRNPLKLNLSQLKQEQQEYIRQNTPTPYGSIKKQKAGPQSNRDSMGSKKYSQNSGIYKGPLTSRSNQNQEQSIMHISKGVARQRSKEKNQTGKSPYARDQMNSLRGSKNRYDSKQKKRFNRSPSNDDRFLNEDSQTMGQMSQFEQNIYIGAVAGNKIDTTDKDALISWHKSQMKKNKSKKGQAKGGAGQLRRSNSGSQLNDIKKIAQLYQIYGSDNLALVHPAEQPGTLLVRKRSAQYRKILRQMGVNGPTSQSQFNNSHMQNQASDLNNPFANYQNAKVIYQDGTQEAESLVELTPNERQTKSNIQFGMPSSSQNDYLISNAAQGVKSHMTNQQSMPKRLNQENSIAHLQQSNVNKGFRGFANVVSSNALPQTAGPTLQSGQKPKGMIAQNSSQGDVSVQPGVAVTVTSNRGGLSRRVSNPTDVNHQVAVVLPKELNASKPQLLDKAFAQKRQSQYDDQGSPRIKPQYVEVDVNNPQQLEEIGKALATKKSKQSIL